MNGWKEEHIIAAVVVSIGFCCNLSMPLKIFIYRIKYWRRQVCAADTCHSTRTCFRHDSIIQPSISFWDVNNLINLMHTSGLIGWVYFPFFPPSVFRFVYNVFLLHSSRGDYYEPWVIFSLGYRTAFCMRCQSIGAIGTWHQFQFAGVHTISMYRIIHIDAWLARVTTFYLHLLFISL